MRLGTCLPRDDSAQVDGQFSLAKALEALAGVGIRGCLHNLVADESRWETSSRALAALLEKAGITLLEYNAPLLLQPPAREQCPSLARSLVRALQVAESIGCLNVAVCPGGFGQGIGPHPRNRGQTSWDLLKETCLLIAEEAARRNLRARLEIELVYTSAIWSPLKLAQFVDEIGSPNIQGHMDIVNVLHFDIIYDHTDFIRESFALLDRRFHSAHIKDVAPRETYLPGLEERYVGEGVCDLATYLDCLATLPADFPVIIEHMPSMEVIARSYEYVRGLAQERGLAVWSA